MDFDPLRDKQSTANVHISGGNAGGGSAVRSTGTASNTQAPRKSPPPFVSFNRKELDKILRVYGHRVADGEWRDYAIDHLKDKAVFSIFRRASEAPLFRVEKDPKLAQRQGAYSVVAPGGMILKRGRDLEKVLRVLEKRRHLSVV